MLRKCTVGLGFLIIAAPVYAGGGIGYSTTDDQGTVERVVERRALRDDLSGALVSYTRTDGSRSFVEYAIRCESLAFAYLGIADDDVSKTPNLLTVRTQSDRLLNNDLMPVKLAALDEDTSEASIRKLAMAVCS